MPSNKEAVYEIITSQLGLEDFSDSSNFVDDLGCDSLDYVELLMEAEEHFDIDISDVDAEAVRTVADAVALIDRLTRKEQA